MSTKPRFGFAIEYVNDIEAARAFYEDVLGLEMQRYHPTFVQFENFAIASDKPLAGGGGPELYWLVEDATKAFRELSARVEVSLDLREMPYGKVFAVKDPDGRPRFLLELAQDRPSQQA